jgi:hypothetical protein
MKWSATAEHFPREEQLPSCRWKFGTLPYKTVTRNPCFSNRNSQYTAECSILWTLKNQSTEQRKEEE